MKVKQKIYLRDVSDFVNVTLITKSKLFKFWPLKDFNAITLGKYILFKEDYIDSKILEHELVHVRQIMIHGFFKFYFLYLYYFLENYYLMRDFQEAYRLIPFEIEARKKAGQPI